MARAYERIVRFTQVRHIETTVLLIGMPALLAVFLLFNPSVFGNFDQQFIQALLYYLFFGWAFLKTAVIVLYFFLLFRFLHFWVKGFVRFMREKGNSTHLVINTSQLRTLQSILFIITIVIVGMFVDIVITDDVLRANADHVRVSSDYVMGLDMSIFGSNVSSELSELITSQALADFFLEMYLSIGVALSGTVLILLLFSKQLFREFIMAFLLIPLFSVPIWYQVSAVSPSEAYRRNVFEHPPPIALYMATHPEFQSVYPGMEVFLERIEKNKSQHEYGVYANTAFPSMHVAWGMLVVFYLIRLFWPLALVVVPWQIANIIGAVMSLQHYAIDVFLGVAVMIVVVFIVRALHSYEEKYRHLKSDGFVAIDVLQKDAKEVLEPILRVTRKLLFRRKSGG